MTDADSDLTAALHTIGEFGEWIRSADSKATLLAAVQGLLITSSVGRLDGVRSSGEPLLRWLEASTSAVFLVALAISAMALIVSHIPRLPALNPTRFAFPVVALLPEDALCQRRSPDELLGQAWWQASTLARIAVTKYRWLRAAGVLTFIAVALFLLCSWLSVALPPS